MRKIKCTISSVARAILTIKKRKALYTEAEAEEVEFNSFNIESEHPEVQRHIEQAVYKLDPGYVIEWELQPSGEFRWHVKKHLTTSRTDEPFSVYICQWPEATSIGESGEYRPIDWRVVRKLERIAYWNQSPERVTQFIEQCRAKEAELQEETDAQTKQDGEDLLAEYRSVAARLAWANGETSSDPGWERGIGRAADGTYVAEGAGATSRNKVKAI